MAGREAPSTIIDELSDRYSPVDLFDRPCNSVQRSSISNTATDRLTQGSVLMKSRNDPIFHLLFDGMVVSQ